MWIRSQDKRILINAKAVCTTNGVVYADDDIETYVIGNYDTEEAIKVLDVIQNVLGYAVERYEKDNMDLNVKTFNVYQMPQKGEVK